MICELLVSLWGDCRTDIHRKGGPAAGRISTVIYETLRRVVRSKKGFLSGVIIHMWRNNGR